MRNKIFNSTKKNWMIVAEKFFERVQCVRGIFYLQCVNVLVTEEFASLKLDGNRNT